MPPSGCSISLEDEKCKEFAHHDVPIVWWKKHMFLGIQSGGVIQFPPEIDENWVRYGLAKLGQISKLPNWQKIVVLCIHNTTSALNS